MSAILCVSVEPKFSEICAKVRVSQGFSGSNARTDPAARQNPGHGRVPFGRPRRRTLWRSAGEDLLAGRSQWITLLCEVLPRALLAELGLARILLGSSGGGQFLLVLPGDAREAAEELPDGRRRADRRAERRASCKLIWGVTDNLGDWAVIRKRLNEELHAQAQRAAGARQAPRLSSRSRRQPAPMPTRISPRNSARRCARRRSVGWSPENPGQGGRPARASTPGRLTSNLSPDGIMLARHAAPQRRRQAGRARADAGAARAGPVDLGRAARRRGQFRRAPAPRAFHRRARAALGAVQAVLRGRTGSALLACRSSGARSASSIPAATISRSTAPGMR